MDWYNKKSYPQNKHAYKLHNGVFLAEKKSVVYLIRKNPLSTITVNPVWAPILNLLMQGEYILFNEVCTHVNADPAKIEIFLNSLVRKGFMQVKGFRELDEYPSVTIIIPVRNRPDDISDCLTSLMGIDYPRDKLEIIVVDDASDDNTPEIITGFSGQAYQKFHQDAGIIFPQPRGA